jgi:hypothetical protein
MRKSVFPEEKAVYDPHAVPLIEKHRHQDRAKIPPPARYDNEFYVR